MRLFAAIQFSPAVKAALLEAVAALRHQGTGTFTRPENLHLTLAFIGETEDLPGAKAALDAVCAPVSLYDPVYADGGDPLTVMDQVRDTRNTEASWMEHITLQNAFRRLSPREKEILSLRFYDGKTQMEVAGLLGISQAQVSRLEKGAIGAMRKSVSVSS